MSIINLTNISNELVKAIALDVGLDLNACTLKLVLKSDSKGIKDGYGGLFTHEGETLVIKLDPYSSTVSLAHELRHAAQSQILGKEAFKAVYEIENEIEGYTDNVLEVDAREAGDRWKV
jgi:hypothetical protein